MTTRLFKAISLIIATAVLFSAAPVTVLAEQDSLLAWESEDEPEDPMPEDDSVIEEEGPEAVESETDKAEANEPATDEPASDEPEAVILEEEAAGVDTLMDENSVDGAVTEEIAEDTLAEDDELLGVTENLVQYLREGADPDTLTLDGNVKEDLLADGVNCAIYDYKANGNDYRALYIWCKSGTAVLNRNTVRSRLTNYATFTDIIMDDSILEITKESEFGNLSKVSYVRLPSKLTTFSRYLFEGCTSLENITIPKTLTRAYGETFWGCTSLKTITFEDGIKKIPDRFARNGNGSYNSETDKCAIETVNIPASVTDIGDEAFYNLRHLTTLNFMDLGHTTLAHIGRQAFGSTNLNSVTLPKFGGKWTDPDTGKTFAPVIEGLAFGNISNSAFEIFIVPEGVTTIDEIWQANKWKEVYLPSTLYKNPNSSATEESGLYMAFFYGLPSTIQKIYYNGTEDQFFTKALGIKDKSWREKWKNESYSAIYSKLVFNSPAPQHVSALSADTTSILKYYDEVTEGQQLTINLAVSPQSHINTVYKAVSSDSSVVSVTLGTEADGILPVKLTFHKKVGDATVTVSGGAASATISVTIKEKDQVEQPLIRLNGGAPFDGNKTVDVVKGDQITIECPTYDSTIEYQAKSGVWEEYAGKIMVGTNILKNAADGDIVKITARAKKTGLIPSYDSCTITFKYKLDWGDVNVADRGVLTSVPEGMWIPGYSYDDGHNTYSYTGAAITCKDLRVFYYNKLLTNGKDYTVKYKDNVNSEAVSDTKASFTVTGKGDYVGCAATGTFTIAQRDIGLEASKLDFTPVVLKYNGKDQKPKLNITFDGRKLTAGKDYKVTFTSSETVNDKGTYIGYITGIGNYTKSTYLNNAVYVIDTGESVNMSTVKVTGVKNQQLTTPDTIVEVPFVVTYNKQTIPSDDSAYTVTYKNNTHAGTASIIFEGTNAPVMIGGKNIRFVGRKILTFKIAPIKLIEPKIDVDTWTYNGKAAEPYTEVKMGLTSLVEGEDYTLSYRNNKNAGTGTVTVTGKGDYTGKITEKFTIDKLDLSGCTVRLLGGNEYEFCQAGVLPKIEVVPYASWDFDHFPDYPVLPPKDYKITYSNYETPGTATITIEGKGNLTGKRTIYYTIKSGNLYNCTTTFTDKIYSRKPNIHKQKLTIKDPYGKTLKAGKDYDKDFRYFYIEDTIVEQKIGKSYFTVSRPANSLVRDEDIIPAGTSIRVEINGMGNYNYSSLYGSFRIGTKKVSSLKFTIPTMKITGVRVLPSKDDIIVKNGSGDDFDIISYGPNNKKGTGTVTVRGRGNYIGTATIKFKIVN